MEYLTVAETAQRLGVKRETVYAYASRGLLTSVRGAQRRGSRFAQDEVEALAARGREAREPSGAVERIRTGITLVADGGPWFRGVAAGEAGRSSSLEDVAGLLWGTGGPVRFAAGPDLLPVARDALAALPPRARATDRFRVAVAALAAADPLRADVAPAAVVARAAALLGTVVDALAGRPEPAAGEPVAVRLTPLLAREPGPASGSGSGHEPGPVSAREPGPVSAREPGPVSGREPGHGPGQEPGPESGQEPDREPGHEPSPGPGNVCAREPLVTDHVRAALVLLADHGLAASTVAARVAASTHADVHAVVSAGLGALDGPRHGLASGLAHRFLAGALDDPHGALAERLRAGERVPGFGHAVYRGPDPRATVLLARLRADPAAERVVACVDALADGLHRDGEGPAPNVDLALAALVLAHDLRPDSGELLFAVARTVGWVAHALEEYAEPGARFRPTGVYTGPRPGSRGWAPEGAG